MINKVEAIRALITFAVLVAGCTAAWYRWWRPKYRAAKATGSLVKATLVGADPVLDPITGAVRAPAIPGIATLHAQTSAVVKELAGEVSALAKNVQVLVDHKLVDLETKVQSLDSRVTSLEVGRLERVANHVATAESFRAMGDLRDQPPFVPPEQPDLD